MRLDDPLTHDETEQLQRQDESIREQRWNEFVEWLRGQHDRGLHWQDIADNAVMAWASVLRRGWCDQQEFSNFAETEGWSGVLIALAQALRQTERQ